MKRSTATAVERMKADQIHAELRHTGRIEWCLAMKITSLPDERWAKKAAKWNAGFSTMHQTNRPVGRPKKR